jgi:hypothetical protein
VTRERHPADEAMEHALEAKDRAIEAARAISDAVPAIMSSMIFGATLQPSSELLNKRTASLASDCVELRAGEGSPLSLGQDDSDPTRP